MPTAPPRAGAVVALVACALLLAAYAVLALAAVRGKSATSDEVIHAPAGYTHLRYFDFRANPEHPPLWKCWAALPWLVWPPADANVSGPAFADVSKSPENHWAWAVDLLYHTSGNDPVRLIGMSRAMMVVPALVLGALLAWWAWRLAGAVAAVVACGLYALDPNFLAHGPLVTNDVTFSLAVLLLAYATWRLLERVTVRRAVAVAACCGFAFLVKFTSVLLAPALVLTLVVRALLPAPWPSWRGDLTTRGRRLMAAAALSVFCAAVTYAAIWAGYGFRFRSAPDPSVRPDVAMMTRDAIVNEIMGTTGHGANEEDIRNWTPSLYTRACLFALEHRLAPEAYTYGVLFAYSKSLYRWSYFMGRITGRGNWNYFPVAFLVKTPLVTLFVIAASLVALGVMAWRRRGRLPAPAVGLALCLGIPFLVLGYAFIRSHMNIGLRHAFPLYPILFLLAGIVAGRLHAMWPRLVGAAVAIVGVGLAVETLPSYPNYIPFFNAAAGGYRGGFRILGDSNLDWGQDLPLLAEWQRRNPDRTLYLAYQGTADPAYYGIRYTPLTLNTGFQVTRREFPTSGVVAASATMLQNDWLRPAAQEFFHRLRDTEPDEILGGSIYVFDLDRRQ